MRCSKGIILAASFSAVLAAQTAEELVARNLEARGGMERIKAIKTLRMTGRIQQGSFSAVVASDSMLPKLLRQTVTIQGMSQIQAYDGATGWQVSPMEGRKTAELIGEDELHGLVEDADFYGPLVDYKTKDNRVEYLGHDTVDGDDAYRLKVTLANGDILYYYLDPDTYLEIRTEKTQFIRGSVRESFINLGSYKLVNGVYFPFSLEMGSPRNPEEAARITIDRIEANVAIDPGEFKMPGPPAGAKE